MVNTRRPRGAPSGQTIATNARVGATIATGSASGKGDGQNTQANPQQDQPRTHPESESDQNERGACRGPCGFGRRRRPGGVTLSMERKRTVFGHPSLDARSRDVFQTICVKI